MRQFKQILKILEKFRSDVNDRLTQMSDFALLLSSLNTYSGKMPVVSAHASLHNFFLVTACEVRLGSSCPGGALFNTEISLPSSLLASHPDRRTRITPRVKQDPEVRISTVKYGQKSCFVSCQIY